MVDVARTSLGDHLRTVYLTSEVAKKRKEI